jgi:hypothetical protein
VKTITLRLAKGAAIFVTLGFATACGLPSSGPNKAQIFSGSVLEQGDAFILTVDDRVNTIASVMPALGFAASFRNAATLGSDMISPGDVLGLTIWENVDDGLKKFKSTVPALFLSPMQAASKHLATRQKPCAASSAKNCPTKRQTHKSKSAALQVTAQQSRLQDQSTHKASTLLNAPHAH